MKNSIGIFMNAIQVIIESGKKRTFANALDWPGWCRSGRDKQSALQALADYGPRYAQVVRNSDIEFQTPTGVSEFVVTERLEGNATTDFGAPAIIAEVDRESIDQIEFVR
jgi:hypothetical protein